MSVTNPVLDTGTLSRTVVRDLLVDGLQDIEGSVLVVGEDETYTIPEGTTETYRFTEIDGELNVEGELNVTGESPKVKLFDPLATRDKERQNKQAPFVLTSYPNVGVSYPHLVVRETNIELEPIDRTQNVWSGPFSAGIEIIATNATEKFVLKDAVRAFVVRMGAARLFQNAGFNDVSIDSTDAIDWDDTTETESLEISISGEVYVN